MVLQQDVEWEGFGSHATVKVILLFSLAACSCDLNRRLKQDKGTQFI